MIDLKSLYGDRLADLTDRQRDIHRFILDRVSIHGAPPTIREIGTAFDIKSPNGVRCHLMALARKGFLNPTDGKRIALKGLRFVPVREGA